jgi:hypothetical protein
MKLAECEGREAGCEVGCKVMQGAKSGTMVGQEGANWRKVRCKVVQGAKSAGHEVRRNGRSAGRVSLLSVLYFDAAPNHVVRGISVHQMCAALVSTLHCALQKAMCGISVCQTCASFWSPLLIVRRPCMVLVWESDCHELGLCELEFCVCVESVFCYHLC